MSPPASCLVCGAREKLYGAASCARCFLRIRLGARAAFGDPAAVAQLAPYLAALQDGPRPWSVLNWTTVSAGYQTLGELIGGQLEVSHDALDGVDRGQSTTYLRAALVRTGVLETRDEQSAKLAAFITGQVARLTDGEDRTTLRAFAVWEVQHDLARRERRGETERSSDRLARTRIRTAVDLLVWLHAQQLVLADLRQEHLDHWVAHGSSADRRVRAFVVWARRRGLIGALDVGWHQPRQHTDPLPDTDRAALLAMLLGDESIDLRDRVAGSLLLLLAQPLSRLTRLTIGDVDATRRPVRLHLGRDPLELPEPLGALAAELARQRPGLATTAADDRHRWLFPGLRLDAPLHPETLRRRLAKLGISARPSRAASLLQLAQTVPPAILADLLGLSETCATRWTNAAQGSWTRYAADAAAQLRSA